MSTASSHQISRPLVRASEISFRTATPVTSDAQKLVIPVPVFIDGGEPLVYPESDERAGDPICDGDDNPLGENGVVFWNTPDRCWQAAPADGSHVIIFNQTSKQEAEFLLKKYTEHGGPARMSLAGIKAFMEYATSIGLSDFYLSTAGYARTCLMPVISDALQIEYKGVITGLMKQNEQAIAKAVYQEGLLKFVNTEGVIQDMSDGCVIVQQGNSIHAIQPGIFCQTYRLAKDGSKFHNPATDLESVIPCR
ncbi:MAG: hypothetical protein GY703_07935 [Gammaproteobacteria bacterium]|nr:hypothetical protein [Gammaproteobacteria bacterium]